MGEVGAEGAGAEWGLNAKEDCALRTPSGGRNSSPWRREGVALSTTAGAAACVLGVSMKNV